nr:lipase secretion chaperone [Acinetobacter sp. Marseille-Q1620]
MHGLQQRHLWIMAGIIILVLAIFFWLKPRQSPSVNIEESNSSAEQNNIISSSIPTNTQSSSLVSQSQQDTQINCQIRLDNSNRLIVNEQTKNCFEYFITQYGEKAIPQIKDDFNRFALENYKEPALSQLTDLWSRYMQYREKLGNLSAPDIDKNDPKYYRTIFASMQNLRKQFFSDYEIQGLFGEEDTYNQYTLNRMDILANKNLDEIEKAQKLKELFNSLPVDWKENLTQLSQLDDLRKLTSDLKARGGSAEELHNMRLNLVGAEATQRLENLDTQRDQWKQRVNEYLSARDSIQQSSMSDSAKQDAINQLRTEKFNNPQEQARLHTFENVHDQGGKLPY